MNIQIQLCGMLILVLLYIFYKSNKTLQLYTERVFHRTMCVAIISLFLDILSIVMIVNRQKIPLFFVNAICKFYIITLVWMTMMALDYVLTDLYSETVHKRITKKIFLLTAIQSLIVCLVPIYIYENGKEVYTYGPAVLCVYGFVLLYMLSTVVVIFRYIQKMNKRRVLAIVLWMSIWIIAAMIQFLNNELLIVGFASAIGVLILFVIIENPEANLDKKLGCFNSYALTEYGKLLIERDESFSLMEVCFGKLDALEEYGLDMETIMQKVLHLANRYTGTKAFKNINSNLLIIGKNSKQLRGFGEKVLEVLADYDILHRDAGVILVLKGNSFVKVEDLFHFLTFVRNRYEGDKSRVFIADEDVIMKYRERSLIETQIADALEDDRVEVFYQPIYSNKEHKFTSAEALVRIRKEDGNLLPPGVFIPVSEKSGQIIELGDRIFEKVCELLKNTEGYGLGIHYIEVNLSVVQCEIVDLADRLISIIEKYGVNPSKINLEITETASIKVKTNLEKNMKKLIDYGFTFSLDDFGKGESNLMYMVEMPVSLVKLDYDMSKAFFSSEKAKHVVRAVVNMAHDMNMKLVAEGIETKQETEDICREGIDYIQGYYYAKPLPEDEFLTFMENKNQKAAVR